MRIKRCNYDYDHCQQFSNWFELRNPFSMKDGSLYSLQTGVVSVYGKEPVNCDQAEIMCPRVQASFDDSKMTALKITKKDLFVSLA